MLLLMVETISLLTTSDGKEKCGIGLGMQITRMIAEDHSGKIYVCSQKGEGTTFVINFPH